MFFSFTIRKEKLCFERAAQILFDGFPKIIKYAIEPCCGYYLKQTSLLCKPTTKKYSLQTLINPNVQHQFMTIQLIIQDKITLSKKVPFFVPEGKTIQTINNVPRNDN